MRYYDLYGTRTMAIEELQAAVASAVEISFDRRYNEDNGTYYKAKLGEEVFDIRRNFQDDAPEDEVMRPEFADYPVLLFVSLAQRAEEVRDLLLDIPGVEHLRRDTRE